MSNDIAMMPATALLDAYAAKKLSPVEVTQAALKQIEIHNESFNSFCLVDADGALAAARSSEARWMQGAPIGVLDGVPATVKDLILTKGWPTQRGSKTVDPKQNWDTDGPSAARLREANAVLLGKTTSPEFGWTMWSTSPLTGATRNPWDRTRTSGGSSAGAAVAAALGQGALHIGTDGGGSVRMPAAYCGIVGLKPTFGRVPFWPPSPFAIVGHVGPMTRTVEDCALMLDVMSRPDPRDGYALPTVPAAFRAGLKGGVKGLKIALSLDLGFARVDPQIRTSIEKAAQVLAEQGAIITRVDPGFPDPFEAFFILWSAGAAKLLSGIDVARHSEMDPGFVELARRGAAYSAINYLSAEAVRVGLVTQMNLFHQNYDLLLTPAMPTGALPLEDASRDLTWYVEWMRQTQFSYPFNLTRQPAITVPCGLTSDSLPIGLQIVGRLGDDSGVLRTAYAFEGAAPWTFPKVES
jgi:aspartyl-tRNA(Asn)/glutamyl-tRNA(Gln) amidotransferase subunit A